MPYQRPKALPTETQSVLVQLSEALRGGTPPRDLLDEALAQVAALPPEQIVRADREIAEAAQLLRECDLPVQWWLPESWRRVGESRMSLLEGTPRLEQLFIFHRDGRLREAALDKFEGGLDSTFLVAAVALRLNDWAAPVRAAAKACAERVFPRTDAEILARALVFLIRRKPHWQRWGKEPTVIAAVLARPDVVDGLADLFRTGEFEGLAAAFRQALRLPEFDVRLLDLATAARQPAVRAMALRTLIEGRAKWLLRYDREWIDKVYNHSRRRPVLAERAIVRPIPLEDLIAQGLADSSPAIRRVAADGVIQYRTDLSNVGELARRLISDGSQAVRRRGEFLLREEGRVAVDPDAQ